MHARVAPRFTARRLGMIGAALLAGTAWPTLAQTQPGDAPAAAQDQSVPEAEQSIVVTGYRASLQSSTNAKKNSVGFTDSIFAEDIGKFPDTNIAESFNRIPGVTIAREVTGEGLNVTIRGLGTNFTRVLLNGAPVAVASTGRTDSQNTNREVDLDMFPTELFTSLTVNKSGIADQVEGGAAGTVNMRSARPFDRSGTRVTYGAQLTKNTNAKDWGYRGSLLASTTMGDFGVLLGVAGVHNKVRTTGFETIGWTNPNLSAAQCGATSGCNPTGGGNWTIPGTVPANSGAGLVTGTTIDQAFLLARNPGATISQIDNGIIPRLGRPMFEEGTKDRINAIASLEYKGDRLHAYVDGMFGWKDNQLERVDMNWVGRNGAAIPINTQYDRSDCTQGCVVTKGTYANAQWFLEYRPFIEKTKFWGVNPGLEWEIADKLKVDLQGNYTWSSFHRESPSVVVLTAPNSGVVVNYDNSGGDVPSITTNIDLNNPANFAWPGGRVNIQDERRQTETKGVRGNLTWGDNAFNLKVGAAYDDTSRRISAFDNSQAWQNAVCGNRPSVFLPSPNTQPPCNGLVQPGAAPAGYPTYPAYGTGYSSGASGGVTYGGSLISNAQLAGLLRPTSAGFVTVDWNRFKAASNYDAFHNAAPEAGSSNTGASGGYVREKVVGAYAEVNGDLQLGDNHLNYNAGVRYVHTDQTIGGRVSISDPRNSQDPDGPGPLPAACPGTGNPRDGSCYPNITNFVYTDTSYTNWLPSVSGAFHIGDAAVVRAAVSRTMTRPNPNTMLPGLNFSTPSADVGSVGNPSLQPYLSTNIDLGFEYYTGKEGYVGFTAFRKAVTGFTTTGTVTVPFTALATYGVTYDTLTPTQQIAINSRGGPNSATVVLNQQVNATGTLKVNGLEVNWVQPLDFLLGRIGLNGFGFNANLTLIDQTGSGAAPAVAVGVSPVTYNITGYYEQGGINIRLSTTFQRGSVSSDANQNGIALARLYSNDYQQFDMSASVDFAKVLDLKWGPELTLDVINLTRSKQRSYFQFNNAAFTLYDPGRQVMVGLRGRFQGPLGKRGSGGRAFPAAAANPVSGGCGCLRAASFLSRRTGLTGPMTEAKLIAGIELGGTKCVALLATGPDDVRDRATVPTTDPRATLAAIEAVLDRWTFDAMGVASFGPLGLDPARADYGTITATTKPGWSGTDLIGRLNARYGKPIGFQTDVEGAALAEGRWGAAQGMAAHAYITIGTGVGVGLVSGGRPVMGWAHGEAGHMRLPRAPGDTYPGWCRFHGDCLEGLIAGPALAERFGMPGDQLPDDAPGWDLFVHDLAGMLHNLVVTAAPERIAIGGGVTAARPYLFPKLRARLVESLGGYGALAEWAEDIEARLGTPGLGTMAGPLGAIAVGLGAGA